MVHTYQFRKLERVSVPENWLQRVCGKLDSLNNTNSPQSNSLEFVSLALEIICREHRTFKYRHSIIQAFDGCMNEGLSREHGEILKTSTRK